MWGSIGVGVCDGEESREGRGERGDGDGEVVGEEEKRLWWEMHGIFWKDGGEG